MTFDINDIKNLDEINNSKMFAKIPNDFFYNGGEILNRIGGRDGFLIYCLLTSRKTMNDDVYISTKEMVNVLQLEKNVSRSKLRITKSLLKLKENKYIKFNIDLKNTSINEVIKIKWIELFPKLGGKGWNKFCADDFEIYEKIGNIPYMVMWVLRMYVNHETKTSFISIADMTDILKCDRNKVQNAVNLFKTSRLFNITGGEYYYHPDLGIKIRKNNEYTYTGNIDVILSMSSRDIDDILFPERIKL